MTAIDKSFTMNHTCLRVTNPKVTIPFYEKHFGMKVIRTFDFPGLSLFILNIENEKNKSLNWAAREGILEICHFHGVENDPNHKINTGNGTEFRGFGHICFSVDNIEKAEQTLLANDVKFQKTLSQGVMKDIAFALDPDGYWIELIEHGVNKVQNVTDQVTYKLNHTMIRVKDPKKSLEFYKNALGFKLIATTHSEAGKFSNYFLAYVHDDSFVENSMPLSERHKLESLIELTHNWGTEDDEAFSYHDGNSTENGAHAGYAHTCVSCDDSVKFCKGIEEKYGDEIKWAVKVGTSPISAESAFIMDPDGYQIEIIPRTIFLEA